MENRMRLQATTDDFIRAFEDNLAVSKSQKSAYEATERQHERLTGHRRYTDYESFYVIRSRKMRKK